MKRVTSLVVVPVLSVLAASCSFDFGSLQGGNSDTGVVGMGGAGGQVATTTGDAGVAGAGGGGSGRDAGVGSGCRFRDTSGWAIITKIVYSSDPGHECQAMVTFDFATGLGWDAGLPGFAGDGGTPLDGGARVAGGRMLINPVESPPCTYLQSNGIVVDGVLPATRQDETAGACPTPVYVFPGIEHSQYMGP
jgi:hypothetical protein